MTPSYRNVLDTCLYTKNYFCQVAIFFGDCSRLFSACAVAGQRGFAVLDQSLAH